MPEDRCGLNSYGVIVFFPCILLLMGPCACPPRVKFLFPPILHNSFYQTFWPSKPDYLGASPPFFARPQTEKSDMGLRTFTLVRKLYLHSPLEVFLGEISNRYAAPGDVVMSNHCKHWGFRDWILGSRAGFVSTTCPGLFRHTGTKCLNIQKCLSTQLLFNSWILPLGLSRMSL